MCEVLLIVILHKINTILIMLKLTKFFIFPSSEIVQQCKVSVVAASNKNIMQ